MNRRLAIVPVTTELLRQLLHLPETVRIDNVSLDLNQDRVLLRLEGPEFPEVTCGEPIVMKGATFRRAENGAVEFVGWT